MSKKNPLSEKFKARDHQIIESDDVLPLGSRIMFFIGSKGSSKTTTILNLLSLKESPYKKYFKNIILISPSAHADSKLGKLYEELDRDGKVYDELNEETIDSVVDQLETWNAEAKKPIENLIIIDDSSDKLPTGKKPSSITKLFTNSRHWNASVWLVSHKFTSIPTIIRNQVDCLFIFKTNSKYEIKSFQTNLNVDEHVFERNLAEATSKPYGFMFLNLIGGKPKYYDRFDELPDK